MIAPIHISQITLHGCLFSTLLFFGSLFLILHPIRKPHKKQQKKQVNPDQVTTTGQRTDTFLEHENIK